MNILIKNIFLFCLLIFLVARTYGQQARLSRPMIAVTKRQPAYLIMMNGEKLPDHVLKDITRIDIHERLNSAGSLIIKLNNRDDEKRPFKSDKRNPFHQGDKIEIFLVKDKNLPSRRLIKSTITVVKKYNSKTDSSFVLIEGIAQKPDITHQAKSNGIVYKIDASNRNQFTLEKERRKDLVKVSWYDRNEAFSLPDLKTGRKIQLNGLGDTYNGVYYILEVTHTFSASGNSTHFELSRNDSSE